MHPLTILRSIFAEPCTMFPNKLGEYDLSPCCQEHDYRYSAALGLTKQQSDEYLWYCVRESTGLIWLADLMYYGVSWFGWPFWWWHRVQHISF